MESDEGAEGKAVTAVAPIPRWETGVPNLDAILDGGLPKGAVAVLAGPPGSGKTILAEQFCFHNASPQAPALYFSTLSEPVAKTLLFMSQFSFFDQNQIDRSIHLVDLGEILRAKGLAPARDMLIDHVSRIKPAIVVIDSFKTFDDLATSIDELRKFVYQVGVDLMAWEVTALLLGEYAPSNEDTSPVFSVVDGLMELSRRELSGEWQRFLQVHKMRGIGHNRDQHSFAIGSDGIQLFAPRVTIQREIEAVGRQRPIAQVATGNEGLDRALGGGIPRGFSVLVSGVAGTGKTALLLDFLYRGAQAGEKGVLLSFEETPDLILAIAHEFGWDLATEIEREMIEIIYIPQPNILVDADLLTLHQRIVATKAQRVAVDSASVFLYKITDARIAREKIFHLGSAIWNSRAVGLFAADVPYGSGAISRFGVEETVVDGVIFLTMVEENVTRQRYLEVYKLRGTQHLMGRHKMLIGRGGVQIFPSSTAAPLRTAPKRHRRGKESGGG
jgi:circadian clock protein KaiC